MHRAENRAHRREPNDAGAQERQRTVQEATDATIRDEQQHEHRNRRRGAEPTDLGARAGLHEDGEVASAAHGHRDTVGAGAAERSLELR